jgi:hypothetical protein
VVLLAQLPALAVLEMPFCFKVTNAGARAQVNASHMCVCVCVRYVLCVHACLCVAVLKVCLQHVFPDFASFPHQPSPTAATSAAHLSHSVLRKKGIDTQAVKINAHIK